MYGLAINKCEKIFFNFVALRGNSGQSYFIIIKRLIYFVHATPDSHPIRKHRLPCHEPRERTTSYFSRRIVLSGLFKTHEEFRSRFDALIHAYSLMRNHYHLLIETSRANLDRIIWSGRIYGKKARGLLSLV